jgi:hypothetical protein
LLSIPFVAALALAGCSGSGPAGGSAPGLLPAGLTAAAAPSHPHTTTTLRITIPKKVRIRDRHPRSVSPSTLSATIAIAPNAGCTKCSPAFTKYIGLTTASPNCTGTASGTVCSFDFVLTPGSYTGSMTTYDGALNTSGHPTGSVLSLDQSFPLSLVAGKANAPTISLYGVPVNLWCQAVSTTSIAVLSTNCSATFFVVAAGVTSTFLVYAQDVDGNIMLGPGAPAFSAAGSGITFTTRGNTISVTPPAISANFLPFSISAASPACTDPSAVCSYATEMIFDSVVAEADGGNNSVQVFSQLQVAAGAGAPLASIKTGISNPSALAFDKSGNLFIVNVASVTEYAPPYTGAPIATITQNLNAPYALSISADGKELAVLNGAGSSPTAEVFDLPYSGTVHQATLGTFDATALAFDTGDNLWISFFSNTVARYPKGVLWGGIDTVLNNAANGVSPPASLVLDSNNNLFVAEGGTGKIDQFSSPSYSGSPVYSSGALPGLSSIAMTENHSTIVGCGNGTYYFYKAFNFNIIDGGSAPGTCTPAFDRQSNLELTYSSPGKLQGLTYDSAGPFWQAGRAFTSTSVDNPVAVATWP